MKNSKSGFTLLEILLVVGIIAILAGIVIVAINPARQLAQTRNAERRSDLKQLYSAMNQYYIDYGHYPATSTLDFTLKEVCDTGTLSSPSGLPCIGLIDLSELVPTYITAIPKDPTGPLASLPFIETAYAALGGTGYILAKDPSNKIVMAAPQAEAGAVIALGTTTPVVSNTYRVTYNGNTNTSGTVPTDSNTYISGDSVTVLDNSGLLLKSDYNFNGWNTSSDGMGTEYFPGNIFSMPESNVTLYAHWILDLVLPDPPTHVIASTSTPNEVNLSWTAPLNSGSSPIEGYAIFEYPSWDLLLITQDPSTSAVIRGLTNGVSYSFAIRSRNGVGTGNSSLPSNEVTPTAPVLGCTATGGTIDTSTVPGYAIHTFTTVGSDTFTVTSGSCDAEVLVVAGGGSGGIHVGGPCGGGGAGGVIYNTAYAVTPQTYAITVGAGGAARAAGSAGQGNDGNNSIFGTLIAIGGGGGAGGSGLGGAGRPGGSGGGGNSGTGSIGGAGTTGQGYAGGKGRIPNGGGDGGGGGGGAGGVGGSLPASGNGGGNGGPGITNSITGIPVEYAGGGGGGTFNNGVGTAAGTATHGGGLGNYTWNLLLTNGGHTATNGTPNTGGGGGGGGYQGDSVYGQSGAGGSGVVIVRYAI